ncbi:Bug family tripartite tricarboxylate transporter substrate binding protein [Roseomonas sp. CCTCC AB2023176]|uniref:Bug family tripartite tricarboxylate transporter substrate binding protein n=1 Tax=Roseomonas sp. CCTCC AB2023176 TaxID=3342640 RepID=UPI0035D66D53
MRRTLLLLTALMLPGLAAAQGAAPDNWPNRPITLLGGFPNSSGVDLYQRRLAEPLSRALGVPVIVDNRIGAGGNIASALVARARPDGYMFLLATAGTHAINAALYRNLGFDVFRDVTHIAHLGDVPNILLVNPKRHPDWRTCQDVMAAARARPGAFTYGSTGNGASTHLAGARFAKAAGIDLLHVPFAGQPMVVTSLLNGDVDILFNQVGPALGLIQSGEVRALGVTTAGRVSAVADVPTMAEACNLPGFESSTWYAVLAPPSLPEPIQRRMNAEINRIISEPGFRSWLVDSQGIVPPTATTPEQFRTVHQADIARWGQAVRESGATVD